DDMNKKTTLILDGTPKTDLLASDVLKKFKELICQSGSPLLVLQPTEMKIHYCTGCFHCWLKDPGMCVFDDDGRTIARAFSRAERVVFFTPLIFGTYNKDIKNAVERSISILLPTFRKWKGEMHHPVRYQTAPDLIGIGFTDHKDDAASEIFRRHLMRNALNFNAQSLVTTVFTPSQSADEAVEQLKRALEKPEEIKP
ncbi:MAG: NAD(P)H-dependent oxidoreductase, partial [Proteobacteria bacterium]|nr:NAD(P)H-dependent oxidoreductase [Pseudomonadota bacterium]